MVIKENVPQVISEGEKLHRIEMVYQQCIIPSKLSLAPGSILPILQRPLLLIYRSDIELPFTAAFYDSTSAAVCQVLGRGGERERVVKKTTYGFRRPTVASSPQHRVWKKSIETLNLTSDHAQTGLYSPRHVHVNATTFAWRSKKRRDLREAHTLRRLINSKELLLLDPSANVNYISNIRNDDTVGQLN